MRQGTCVAYDSKASGWSVVRKSVCPRLGSRCSKVNMYSYMFSFLSHITQYKLIRHNSHVTYITYTPLYYTLYDVKADLITSIKSKH
jgi:hypothetical protein